MSDINTSEIGWGFLNILAVLVVIATVVALAASWSYTALAAAWRLVQ